MITLTSTLVATVLVMIIALVLGVWTGRSRTADRIIRPILDAFQTFPSFVYLVPALALFGPTRFTAIVAATRATPPDRGQAGGRRHPRGLRHDGRGRPVPVASRAGR